MEAIIALVVAAAFAHACANVLKQHPAPFYIVFALAGAIYASGMLTQSAPAVELALIPFLRRASLAFGLFTVVMFVGVLPESNAVRKRLAPVRGTLSLLGAILILVHILGYAATYIAAITTGTAGGWIVLGLLVGCVVAVLLAVLAVTSIPSVRKGMDAVGWKRLQKLAYPFYLLMYVHLAAMLAPSSLVAGNSAINLAVYTVVVVAYVVLRVLKASRDKKAKA